jgi:hypothetical protein
VRRAPLLVAGLALGAIGACHSSSHRADRASTSSSSSSTTVTTVRYSGDAHSPFCTMLASLDRGPTVPDRSADAAAVRQGMTRYRDELHRLDAAAPRVIRPDVHELATGIDHLDDALQAVDYSWAALAQADRAVTVEAEMSDPAYTRAGQHLAAYKAQVCHL